MGVALQVRSMKIGKFYKSNCRYYERAASITINYCACFVSITFNARDSAIIEPLCSHGLRIAMCSLMHNQCWISRVLWNPWNKGIDNVTGYNKRKLIRRIVLARISGRPRRNSHICYYVCDRWNKYLPWLLPWGDPILGCPLLPVFLERSQSVGQTNFIKATLPGKLIPLCFRLWRPARSSFGYLQTSAILSKLRSRKIEAREERKAKRMTLTFP